MPSETDRAFSGSIPEIYDTYLVPLIFEPYAEHLCRRLAERRVRRVLEVAAGTGVLSRRMAAELPAEVEIVATDLNQAMLDHAQRLGVARPVQWRQADAQNLPFEEGEFDAVVIQFGAMFFPDKPLAYSEARRVLKHGGMFLFSVWDRIEENEFAFAVTQGLARHFPQDPPTFLPRAPYGYHDRETIAEHLAQAGFKSPTIETVSFPSRAASAEIPATGFTLGSPQLAEIEARGPVEGALAAVEEEITRRFGTGPIEGKIQALVVEAISPAV